MAASSYVGRQQRMKAGQRGSKGQAAKIKKHAMKKKYVPVKPQVAKPKLWKMANRKVSGPRRWKPRIVRQSVGCAGLVIGQAPPGPPESLPKGWKPLAGPTEQRLAKLAGMNSPQSFWQEFDRVNLLSWYSGLTPRSEKQDVAKDYKLHKSDGDIFPMADARRAAGALDLSGYSYVLLLGNNVSKAFGVKAGLMEAETRGRTRFLNFPHPSGVSHFWNTPDNVRKAGRVMKAVLKSIRSRRRQRR